MGTADSFLPLIQSPALFLSLTKPAKYEHGFLIDPARENYRDIGRSLVGQAIVAYGLSLTSKPKTQTGTHPALAAAGIHTD